MKAWTEKTTSLGVVRADSGWIIKRHEVGYGPAEDFVAGISDDEGLLEWFAAQLGFDGAPGNTSANLSADLHKVQEELDQREQQVNLINEALTPIAHHVYARPDLPDSYACGVPFGDLRHLLMHAGLMKQELQARPPNPGPGAEAAGMVPAADGRQRMGRSIEDVYRERLDAIGEALKPVVGFCAAMRNEVDAWCAGIVRDPAVDEYVMLDAVHIRALVKAAGLWTADMLPRFDDEAATRSGQDAQAAAPVRARASVEDASHAGSSGADHPGDTRDMQADPQPPSPRPAGEAATDLDAVAADGDNHLDDADAYDARNAF